MATSAATLTRIIDELVRNRPEATSEAIALLSSKGLLPKCLLAPPKQKKVSRFASKAAEEYAEAKSVEIPEGFKGSGNNDKITVKDIKTLAEGPKKKVNASPSALQYARDNGLDLSRIAQGSGAEGKILLKDVKDLKEPDPPADSEDEEDKPAKISPQAAKLMKQYDIDPDDLEEVEGTGKGGTILAKDLKELVDMIKSEKEEEDDDE